MGATVVEKHFTLDNELDKSADHWLSLDPFAMTIMVENIRMVEELKGSAKKRVFHCEKETRTYDKQRTPYAPPRARPRPRQGNCSASASRRLSEQSFYFCPAY